MCTDPRASQRRSRQRGLTFVELIFFIVIVTVGLAGILLVLDQTTSRSADPMVRKQMLAIAESVLEEVRLQSHGWCDPDDANATTATSAAGCAGEHPPRPGAVLWHPGTRSPTTTVPSSPPAWPAWPSRSAMKRG